MSDFWNERSYDESYDSAKKQYDADVKSATATALRPLVQQSAEEEWAKATGTIVEDTTKAFLTNAYKSEWDAEVAGITERTLSSFQAEAEPRDTGERLGEGDTLGVQTGGVPAPPAPPAPDILGRSAPAGEDTRVGLPAAPLTTREADETLYTPEPTGPKAWQDETLGLMRDRVANPGAQERGAIDAAGSALAGTGAGMLGDIQQRAERPYEQERAVLDDATQRREGFYKAAQTEGTGEEYLTRPLRNAPAVQGAVKSLQEGGDIAKSLEEAGLPSAAAQIIGNVLGGLGAIPKGYGRSMEDVAEGLGAPEGVSKTVGEVSEALAPIPGDRFGALTKARLAATGATAAAGAAAGAVIGDENAPGGMPGQVLKGAAYGAQVGAPALDIAKGAANLVGRAGTALREGAAAIGRDAPEARLGITQEARLPDAPARKVGLPPNRPLSIYTAERGWDDAAPDVATHDALIRQAGVDPASEPVVHVQWRKDPFRAGGQIDVAIDSSDNLREIDPTVERRLIERSVEALSVRMGGAGEHWSINAVGKNAENKAFSDTSLLGRKGLAWTSPLPERVASAPPPPPREDVSGIVSGAGADTAPTGKSDLRAAWDRAVRPPGLTGLAETPGQLAADRTIAAASGAAGAATGPEDQTWQDRAKRGLTGAVVGAALGPSGRGLLKSGKVALDGAQAGVAAGRRPSLAGQTVAEALERTDEMIESGRKLPTGPASEFERIMADPWTTLGQHLIATETPLVRVQGLIEKRLGRPLRAEENAVLRMRLHAGRTAAAAQYITDDLQPALAGLSKAEERGLKTLIVQYDNAEKAASIGRRVEGDVLAKAEKEAGLGQTLAEAGKSAETLRARQKYYLENSAGKVKESLETRYRLWEEAQEAVTDAQTRIEAKTVDVESSIERPDWANGGFHPTTNAPLRPLTDADLIKIAEINDVNPYRPDWADGIDPATIRQYRAEELNATGMGQTPGEKRRELQGLRRELKRAESMVTRIEKDVDRNLERLDILNERARGVEAPNPLLPARKTVDQVRAEAGPKAAEAGRLAAENRVFSGNVRAHPIDQVRAEYVAKYGQESADKMFDAAEGIQKYTANLRERMREAGLISEEVFEAWNKNHASYIPTKILKYLPEDGAASMPAGRSLMSIGDLGIKRLSVEGTSAAREDPIDSLIRLTFAVENQIARQKGAQAFDALRKLDPELDGMFKPLVTHAEAKARGLKKGEYHYSGDGEGGYKLDVNADAKWSIFRDGNAEEYVVPKFLEPLFKLEPNQLDGAAKLAADVMEKVSLAPVLRNTATVLNPLFIPTNAVRDAIQFLVRSDLRKIHQTAPELARAYWDSGPEWGEAVKAGAGMASPYFGLKPDAIRRRLLKEGHLGGRIRPAENLKDFMGAAGDVMSVMATPVRAIGEAVERAPRLAAYRLAKKAGATDAEAALAARDITIDFARGGDLTKFFNRFIPFLAVGVQGVERSITDWKKMPGAMAAGASAGIIASLAAEAWNRSNYEEEYRDVPDYLKETGIVLVTPIKLPPRQDGSRRNNLVLWMPIPNEYQLLKTVVNEGVSRKNGDTPDDWKKVFATLARTISPVGTDTVPLPPSAQVAVELGANYDFFKGQDIVPERYANLPPGRQADERTSAGAKALGQALGVSPFQVEHLTRGVLSGIGGIALEATNEGARLLGKDAPPRNNTGTITDLPVVGGMVGRYARTTAQGQRARDTRDTWTTRQGEVRDAKLNELRELPAYQKAKPEQQREAERLLSNQIASDFNEARSAVSAADRAGKPLPTPPPQAPRTLVGASR